MIKCKCGGTDFLASAKGGLSQNVKCVSCGKEYNYTPFDLEEI